MEKNNLIRILCISGILYLIFFSADMHAQSFYHKFTGYSGNVFQASGVDVSPNAANTATVTHDLWYSLAAGAAAVGHLDVKEMKTSVKFYIDHDDANIYSDYTYRIKYKLRGYKNPADPNQFDDLLDEYLTISYFPQTIKAYQDVQMKTYYGYYKVEVEILDVLNFDCLLDPTPCTPPNYPTTGYLDINNQVAQFPATTLDISMMAKNWALSVDIESQKIDKDLYDGNTWRSAFGNNADLDITKTPPVSPDNHLKLSWNVHNVTADKTLPAMYELEWTYIDNYKVTFSTVNNNVNFPSVQTLLPANLNFDFLNNSTRIITDKTEYKIPLVYKKGYIAYRVRIVRPDLTQYKSNVYGPWTVMQDMGVLSSLNSNNYYDISSAAHLDDLYNWNYQVSYAEEGKSKHVVSYFDGMLKNRQSITKFSSLPDQQIVSESFYNYEGKVGLQTLPVPVVQKPLSFVNYFAKNSVTLNSYKASDIDHKNPSLLPALLPNCPPDKYYAASNPLYNGGLSPQWNYLKYLPDAKGFPLIHTKYAPEDGRVVMQGGAGEELQIGKGHETRFYYLSPEQNEVNKYFGINIGKSSFYEKTITKDPNKQYSFSIANNKGQVVMSGLMGYPETNSPLLWPDKVPVPDPNITFPKKDLMYGLLPAWYGTNRKFSKAFFQETGGTAKLDHTLSLNSFLACTDNGTNYYLNVPVKYNIRVIDDYGQTLFASPNPNALYGTLGSGTVATNISINNAGANQFLIPGIQIGKNIVNYDVSYNPEDVSKVVEGFIDPPPPTFQQILIGNYPVYPLCYKQYNEFVTDAMEGIDEDCYSESEGDISQCEHFEKLLLSDLMPMGRYASYSDEGGYIVGQAGSIFAVRNLNTNTLGASYLTWDPTFSNNALYPPQIDINPNNREASFQRTDYCIFQAGDIPAYLYQYYLHSIAGNPLIPGTTYHVNDIKQKPIKEFLEIYDENIARFLLPMHPEYCDMKSHYCDNTDFVQKLEAIPDLSVAQELNLGTIEQIFDADPLKAEFDANGINNFMLALMTTKLYLPDNGGWQAKNIRSVALVKTFCGEDDGTCSGAIEAMSTADFNTFVNTLPAGIKNEYYHNLVSLYLANRSSKIERYCRNTGCTQPAFSCPIFNGSAKIFNSLYTCANADLWNLPDANNTAVPGTVPNDTKKINDTDFDIDVLNSAFSNPTATNAPAIRLDVDNESGFVEYADEIVKRLSNCRKINQVVPDWTAVKNSLVNYMVANINSAEAKEWKGGITPSVLLTLMLSWDVVPDDLCNPYLVDYLQGTNLMIKTCEEDNFYSSMNLFFDNMYFNAKCSLAVLTPNTFTGGSYTFTTAPNNDFSKRVIRKFCGPLANSCQLDFDIKFNSSTNAFTFRIYDGTFSLNNSVIISLKLDPSIVAGPNFSLSQTFSFNDLYFNNFICKGYGNSNSIPIMCKHCYLGPGQTTSDCDGLQAMNITGTIIGLNEPEKPELSRCITAKEMKDAFLGLNGQGNTIGCFVYDVMHPNVSGGFDIKGYGHPYWETALRSYFNFRFKKTHTSKQYLDFIESCNLTEFITIPKYYGYVYAADNTANVNGQAAANIGSLNGVLTDQVISYVKGLNLPVPNSDNQGLEYSNFAYFNYYTKTGNTLNKSNLYIDFNQFPKEHLRTIKNGIQALLPNAVAGKTLLFNQLENQSDANNFADVFVHYDPTEPDYIPPTPLMPMAPGFVIPLNANWYPDVCMYNTCTINGIANDFFNISNEEVLVRDNNQTYLYKHHVFDLSNGALSASNTSLKTYRYYNDLMTTRQGHKSFSQYVSHLNSDNLDNSKKDYLQYAYSFANGISKDEAIAALLPAELKNNIQPAAYTVNYNNYPYVSYYNPDKAGMSGDLFIKKTNGLQAGIDFVNAVCNYIQQNNGNLFVFNTLITYGNYEVRVRYIGNHTMWINAKDVTTHIPKNLYMRLPDYISANTFPDYELVQNSAGILPHTDNVRRFKLQVHKPGGQFIEVEGKTDFDLTDANILVLENVMLCDDPYDNLTDTISSCYEAQLAGAYQHAKNNFVTYKEEKKKELREKLAYHLQNNISDKLFLETPESKYMMTLYGYDRAGNLIYTVPPEGVKTVTDANIAAIDGQRDGTVNYTAAYIANNFIPPHKKVSSYYYNSNNQVVSQSTPDAGMTEFFYDQAGRLIFSQNAKQKQQNNFSYTLYDKQNRITETGEFHKDANMMSYVNDLKNQTYNLTHEQLKADMLSILRRDVTHTFYDAEIKNLSLISGMSKQEFLRSRVATIASYNFLSSTVAAGDNFRIALHYSYDLNGNVNVLTYDMPELESFMQRYKRIDYDFDLYSGKVKLVSYNRSFADQFYQRYEYDDDNRITKVETSKDGLLWDRDAEYTYYPHGPLARISLGDLRVQGVDFAYTLQGWLKSINGDTPDSTKDMGGDNANQNVHMTDRLRSTLYYYKDDYKPIVATDINNTGTLLKIPDLDQPGAATPQSLYNGNIAASMVIPGLFPSLYTNYQYDQLNRIKAAEYRLPDYTAALPADVLKPFSAAPFNGTATQNVAQAGPATVADDLFKSLYSYDMDGNLTHMKRFGLNTNGNLYDYTAKSTYLLDSLTYWYDQANLNGNNKLVNFTDRVNHTNITPAFDNDLKEYIPIYNGQETDPATVPRFTYDAIGNLTKDLSNNLNYIAWNLYGKMTEIQMDNNNSMKFGYDPLSNRFKKVNSILNGALSKNKNEYYIRDASGNILAIYRHLQGFHLEKPFLQAVTDLLPVGTFPADVAGAFNNVGAFANTLQTQSFLKANSFATQYVNNKSVAFYITNNSNIKKGMIENTANIVPSLLAYNAPAVYNAVTTTFDENMFAPYKLESDDTKRIAFLNLMVDSTQLNTMNAILHHLGYDSVTSKAAFVSTMNAKLPRTTQAAFNDALRNAMDSAQLAYTYASLISDSVYRNASYTSFSYLKVENFVKSKIKSNSNTAIIAAYYGTRADSADILAAAADKYAKLATVYAVEPVDYLTALKTNAEAANIIAAALEGEYTNPYTAMLKLIDVNASEPAYVNFLYNQVVDYDKFYLAEHHLYGSSRLGIKNYWQDQYLYQFDKNKTTTQNQQDLETSEFYYRRPWYSGIYNSLITSPNTTPYGFANKQAIYSERILGQKKYELTNHLGNVMAVVTDKVEQTYDNTGNPSLPQPVINTPSLFAAYDYYPFGMLMTDRYFEDNTIQCIPVSKTRYVKKWIDNQVIAFNNGVAYMAMFAAKAGTSMTENTNEGEEYGYLAVSSGSETEAEVTTTFTSIEAGREYQLYTTVENYSSGAPVTVQLYQVGDNSADELLAQYDEVRVGAEIALDATALTNANFKLVYTTMGAKNAKFNVSAIKLIEYDEVQDSYVSWICNEDEVGGKDYRFGFNGQHKDNEIANIGNHNTALFWEYDTRLGRRWNLDPVKKNDESPYCTFSGNPIYFSDMYGDDGKASTSESAPLTKGKKTFEGGTKQNPNTMTITANYYYNKATLDKYEGAEKALKDAVETYNNSNETIKGGDGKYYKVKFEIKAIPVEVIDPADIQDQHSSKDFAGDGIETYFPYGNTLGVDIPNMEVDGKELGSASTNKVSLNSSNISKYKGNDLKTSLYNVFLHEIGHNLGGAHDDGGAMQTNNTIDDTPQMQSGPQLGVRNFVYVEKNSLTNTNVEKIANTIWGGGRMKGRPGRVQDPTKQ